jgi:hypothetical protein
MNIGQIIIFFAIVTILFILLDFYTLREFISLIKKRNWNYRLIKVTLILSVSMFILSLIMFLGRLSGFISNSITMILFAVISFWYLPKIAIIPFLLIFDIIKFSKNKFLILNNKLFNRKKEKMAVVQKLSLSGRRKFAQNVALGFAGLPFLMAFKGLAITAYNLKVFRVKIPLVKLPLALDGLKIVQISDLHFGGFYSMDLIREMRIMINNLQPDLIFVTGDFVIFSPSELDEGLGELNKLHSKYGIFACLGNHDHYMSKADHQILLDKLNASNMKLMIDSNLVLDINSEKINLASTDYIGRRQQFGSIDKALANLSPVNTTILLLHDPITWEEQVVKKTFVDLTLSGHTHGGQIAFELFGASFSFAQFIYKQYAGLYSKNDQYLYVNRGIGTSGPPMRITMNPEITLLTLTVPDNFG